MKSQLNTIASFLVILMLGILGVLFVVQVVEASGLSRANACNTYNTHAHQSVAENGVDSRFCGNPQNTTQANSTKTSRPHSDEAPTVVVATPTLEVLATPTQEVVDTPPTVETPEQCIDDEEDEEPDDDDAGDSPDPNDECDD